MSVWEIKNDYDPEQKVYMRILSNPNRITEKWFPKNTDGGCYEKSLSDKLYDISIGTDIENKLSLIVDHKNNIKTDNNLTNLQVITIRKNSSKDQFRHNRTSRYTGVNLSKLEKNEYKWKSQIMIGKTNYYLGYFKSEELAHLEYKKALYHLERNIDGLDNYPFESAPMKHKAFLNEMYQNYLM